MPVRRERVANPLSAAATGGREITVSTIARAAGVDGRSSAGPGHCDLLAQVQAAAAEPRTAAGTGPAASRIPTPRPTWPAVRSTLHQPSIARKGSLSVGSRDVAIEVGGCVHAEAADHVGWPPVR